MLLLAEVYERSKLRIFSIRLYWHLYCKRGRKIQASNYTKNTLFQLCVWVPSYKREHLPNRFKYFLDILTNRAQLRQHLSEFFQQFAIDSTQAIRKRENFSFIPNKWS